MMNFGLGGSLPQIGNLRQGLMGSAMNDPMNQGVGQMGMGGNSMNPMGTLQAQSDFATRFRSNPGASPSGGGWY